MKLIMGELRKLCASRAVGVFLIILLSVNFALTVFTSRPLPVEMAAREVYGLYLDDPGALAEYKNQLEADFFEHLRDEEFEVPATFIEGADDMSVLNRVLSRAEYIGNYRAEIKKIADSAERRARDLGYFGYSEDSFYIREQHRLARVYGDLADVLDGEEEYAYGYDVYFENTRVILFVLIWLIFAVSFIFRNDRVCGFRSIMITVRRGRLDTALSKIAVTIVTSVFGTFVFLGTTFLAVGFANGGFSSLTAPLQLLPNYAKVPFEISILGYLGIQTAYRILAAMIFALFVALVSSLGFNYVLCFGFGAIFAAANYYVFSIEYIGTTPAVKYLNLAALAEGKEIFSFHRDMNFLGMPMPYTACFVIILAVSVVILSAVCAFFFCKNIKMPSLNLKTITKKIVKKETKSELRICHLIPLWGYELKKNRILPLSLFAIILLAAHCAFVSASVGSGATYGEAIYYGYISDIKELSSDQRQIYLAKERDSIESVILEYKLMTESYESGEIPYDKYTSYLQKYYNAKDRERILLRVEEYSEYIDRKDCGVIYNTGYEQFFAIGTDWILFAAIVILSIGIFSVEYRSGNCAQIIRTAKKGRKSTFLSKILPYSLIGTLLGGVFRVSGIIVTAFNYELSDFDAALCSIRLLDAAEPKISIRSYLIIDIAASAFAGMMIACTVCLISCIFKKILHALGAVGIILALPALLSNTGFALVNFTSPSRIFNASSKFGADAQSFYFFGIIALHVLTVILFTHIAGRGYIGENHIRRKEKR